MADCSPAGAVLRVNLSHLQIILNGSKVIALGTIKLSHLRVVLEGGDC